MTKSVGIDLGTTNSVLSILSKLPPHHPKIIISPDFKSRTTPSIVNIKFDKKTGKEIATVGKEAENLLKKEPFNTITSVKRFMGSRFSDIKFRTPFIIESPTGKTLLKVGNKNFTPQEISSKILLKLKSFLPEKFWKDSCVVITVPAYFNENQRRATKEAGRMAGLNVARVINEPTAAALAYGINNRREGVIAVYDLGGGTFDVTILRVGGGVYEVLATGGDSMLGGDDVDDNLIRRICEKVSMPDMNTSKEDDNKNIIDINDKNFLYNKIANSQNYQILKKIAEKSKIKLSKICRDEIKIPKNILSPNEHKIELTKKDIKDSVEPIFKKTELICKKALFDSNMSKGLLNEVILVGGMTKMPFIRKSVEDLFNKKPLTSIDPDEAVAKGAAIQSGIIKNIIKDSVLLDVNSLSLGIETLGGVFSKIIKRNSPLPIRKTETFTTSDNNQKVVDINIYQGERPLVKYNSFLGKLKLENIQPMSKGVPRIEVTFEADVDGMIKVYAKDKSTGKEKRVSVVAEKDEEFVDKALKEVDKNRILDEKEKKETEKS